MLRRPEIRSRKNGPSHTISTCSQGGQTAVVSSSARREGQTPNCEDRASSNNGERALPAVVGRGGRRPPRRRHLLRRDGGPLGSAVDPVVGRRAARQPSPGDALHLHRAVAGTQPGPVREALQPEGVAEVARGRARGGPSRGTGWPGRFCKSMHVI